jgi:hypothetical protein
MQIYNKLFELSKFISANISALKSVYQYFKELIQTSNTNSRPFNTKPNSAGLALTLAWMPGGLVANL